MHRENQCRSRSNHRCCHDFRIRGGSTHKISESSTSLSISSCSSNRKRKSSPCSKNGSSGYGCSQPKSRKCETTNKRHGPNSRNLSSRKCRRLDPAGKVGRDGYIADAYAPSSVVRSHNGDGGSHESIEKLRAQSRSFSGQRGSTRLCALRSKRGFDEHRSTTRSSHRRKRRRRSKERVKRKESHANHRYEKVDAVIPIGDVIKRRFEVLRVLGEGSFGQVLECLDRHTQSHVAVKALKRLEDYYEVAKHEVDVLDLISKSDRGFRSNCIETIDFFDWHRHYYIVFPLLSTSVFSFLEQNDYEPYPIEQVKVITHQLCEAMQFIHKLKLCHTDLKPENIMFVSAAYDDVYNDKRGRTVRVVKDPRVKVIDFGSAIGDSERHPSTIQTRHYRAPEVVLECGWSYPADIWSVGCILYELVTGMCLFMTHDNLEHLAMMERFLGPLPRDMIRRSRRRRYFRRGRLDWDPNTTDGRYVRRNVKSLGDVWCSSSDLPSRLAFDLVREMLAYEPNLRITARQAQEHPFFQ